LVKNRPTIALFGGSFDPPHRGHQAIVENLSSFEDIDRVIVMPAFLNPFKQSTLASAKQRLGWCNRVFAGDKVAVSDFEVSQERAVYTIETLKALSETYDIKYLVIGSDNIAQIQQWKSFDEIDRQITWVVFSRGSTPVNCHALSACKALTLEMPISSTEIRTGLHPEQLDPKIRTEVQQLLQQKETHDNQRES
jgi:nicotinate-nucleotide adenylyltransferase